MRRMGMFNGAMRGPGGVGIYVEMDVCLEGDGVLEICRRPCGLLVSCSRKAPRYAGAARGKG
jgi:hypothetical protein